ncbi:Chromodomain Y-like protein 2 [Chionoecetes opilio]|uniref:Chromodomain Y-like protein 2 n=1 Tax=Chionoecetes opilio TaxID=41210 RepID=A0A8J4YMG5_CHIOP|nr:Chromodomain Y-like protein 2 [Chionoecetes opilio]
MTTDLSGSGLSDVHQACEVEKILDQRQKKNKKEYLVQWKNKGPKHNSWEPEENVENCKQIIKKFNDSLKKKDKPVKEPKEPKEPKEAKEPKVRGKVKVAALVAVESSSRSRRTGKNRSYSQFYDQ